MALPFCPLIGRIDGIEYGDYNHLKVRLLGLIPVDLPCSGYDALKIEEKAGKWCFFVIAYDSVTVWEHELSEFYQQAGTYRFWSAQAIKMLRFWS